MRNVSRFLTIVREVRRYFPTASLSHIEGLCVLAVASHDLSPSELAERLEMAPQSATRLVRDYLTAGLIDQYVDPHNAKYRRIKLSEVGREMVKSVEDRAA